MAGRIGARGRLGVLIPPATSLIAGLYLDDIAAQVERTYYPGDPPGHELGTAMAVGMSLRFFS